MSRVEIATAEKLGLPVQAAAVMRYPGWFQQQALRQQFRGPMALLRNIPDALGRPEREAARAALAAAGLPDTAVVAATAAGLHVLSTGGLVRIAPDQEVLRLAPGTFTATGDVLAFTALLRLRLPNGLEIAYEGIRNSLPRPRIPVIAAAVALAHVPAETASR
jgi:hypothetical protein